MMLEQTALISLKNGDKVEHFLLLTSFSIKTTKTGKEYLDMELQDESQKINAKMWSDFESFIPSVKIGTVVKIRGTMDEFNNQPQLRIEKIRLAEESDNVTPFDFLPKSKRSLKEMESELFDRIKKIKNEYLQKLLSSIFTEPNLSKYLKVPAGKAWHHAYIGGLLEHTLEIIRICDLMCNIHDEINRDLIVTGALLHDFGKIEELNFEMGFDYTDRGKLLGHIVIAANIIEKKIDLVDGFPADLRDNLLHLVLSHQGKLEFASPVVPKTLEAIVLYHADELSAKANAYKSAIMNEIDTENGWTKYLSLAETSLHIPSFTKKGEDFKETLF